MRPIVKTSLLTLLIITGIAWASVPPHPRLLEKIRSGEIAEPYYLRHMAELRAQGINAPWSAPALKAMPGDQLDGAQRRFGAAVHPTGSYNALVILVDFSDKNQQVQATFFDTLIFDAGAGSMRDYFSVVSYGDLDVVTVNLPSAIGWARAPQTYAYYVGAAGQNGMGSYPTNSQGLVEDVVNLVNASVDFSQYDNDGDGYVDALFVVHSGSGAEWTGSDNDMWSHAWATYSAILLDGVYVWRYSVEPEYWDVDVDGLAEAGEDMTIGVYAHEMAHAAFGLPDLYDRDGTSSGLGRWTLLAGGSWNGTLGSSPALPDAWTHIQMGYIAPMVHSANSAGYVIAPVADSAEVHLLWTDGGAGNEYFLVENRQLLSFDAALPGGGLLIYHVDESVGTQNDNEWYPGYTASGHYLVALEQADGLWDLETYANSGDGGDPFPGSTANATFNAGSLPKSDSYAGSGTFVAVTNINDGGYFITADLAVTAGEPPVIAVTPDSLWADLSSGGTTDQTLTISNTGTGDLVWSVATQDKAAAPALSAPAPYPDDYYYDIPKGAPDYRVGHAVQQGQGGPDIFGYSWIDSDEPGGPVFDWIDISTTGTLTSGLLDDNYIGPFTISNFAFNFYGTDYTQFYIGSNGMISFGSGSSEYSNDPIPSANTPNNILAWCWDDLTRGTGTVYYEEIDNNTLVIQFVNYGEYGGSGTVNVEVILMRDGTILYQYLSFINGFDVLGSTVGIENADGSDGLEVAYNVAYLHDNLAVRFSAGPDWLSVAPSSGTVGPGGFVDLTVTFDASGLAGGDYDSDIMVTSNDPATAQVRVPAHLSVAGSPQFAVSDTVLDFDTIFVNQTVMEIITFYNLGDDDLLLSNINTNLPEYIPDTSAFLIAPGDSAQLGVTFAPAAIGAFAGNLSLSTNDPDEGSVVIALTGVAVSPSVIAVTPDSLSATLTTIDTVMRTITINNTGANELLFEITTVRRDSVGAAEVGNINPGGASTIIFDPARFMITAGGGSPNASGEPNPITTVQSINKTTAGAGLSVLIAPADDATQLAYYLIQHPDIAVVDFFDARSATPSVATMQGYDVVISWPNYSYYDLVLIGDNLADYVDGGGRVILGNWCWYTSGNYLGGRIMTTDYNPFTGTGSNHSSTSNLGWYVPDHPIMEGVTQVTGYYRDYLSLDAGATSVAEWDDSEQFVGVKDDKPVVYLNIDLGDFYNYWETGDMVTLVSNAVVSQGVSWLAVNPASGSVPPGASQSVEVVIDPAGLYTGEYDAHIVITSNDPVTPEWLVAAHLSFTGTPDIALSDTLLDFDTVFVAWEDTLSMTVSNVGTDSLRTIALSSNHSDFSVSPAALALGPGENQTVEVFFSPSSAGSVSGILTIASDDPDEPTLTVELRGVGEIPLPQIVVIPDSLGYDSLFIGLSPTQSFNVSNDGNAALIVTAITASDPVFTVDAAAFMLEPGENRDVQVTFTPTAAVSYAATLSIENNDALVTVTVSGTGLLPPVIAVTPDSLSDALFVGDTSDVHYLYIDNSAGATDLVYTVKFVDQGDVSMSLSAINPLTTAGMTVAENDVRNIEDRQLQSGGIISPVPSSDSAQPASMAPATHPATTAQFGSVLMIGSGEVTLINALTASGYAVTTAGYTNLYDGSNPAPDGFSTVILADGRDYGLTMPASGQLALLDYVQNGGGFVGTEWLAYQASSYSYMSELILLTRTSGQEEPDTYTVVANHPVTAGLPASFGVVGGSNIGYANAGTVLVTAASAGDAVVVNQVGEGQAVSFASAGAYGNYDAFSGQELQQLMLNAVAWTSGLGGWLAFNQIEGTVAPGAEDTIQVIFDARNLLGGDYRGDIVVASNDPVIPEWWVPAHLDVTGFPGIALLPDSLAFDAVFVGGAKTLEIMVANDGSDLLTVSGISSTGVFSADVALPLSIAPGDSMAISIVYAPTAAGVDTGAITFTSNATDELEAYLFATGQGVEPPVMVVSPEFLGEALLAGDTSIQFLSISNTGLADLVYSIDVAHGAADGPMPPQNGRVTRVEEPKIEGTAPSRAQANDPPAIDRTGGPDPFGYKFSDSHEASGPVYNWIEIATPAGGDGVEITDLTGTDDAYYWPLVLPFTFNFYGVEHTEIAIQSNGTIGFEDTYIDYSNYYIPTGDADVEAFIAHFWDDLVVYPGGIYYRLDPDRVIIEFYQNTPYNYADNPGTWQVILHSNGNIVFQYQDVDFGGSYEDSPPAGVTSQGPGGERTFDYGEYAVVGIQANDSTGLQYSAYEAVIDSGLAVQFTHPDALWLSVSPAGGVLPPDSSATLEVAFDAGDLLGGQYEARIVVYSNDPLAPEVQVPVSLTVTGAPSIVVADSLQFDTTFVGWGGALVLDVFNVGTDQLTVSDITSDNGAFTVDSTAFVIPPGGAHPVTVAFMPGAAGAFFGQLIITSNDSNNPQAPVVLLGWAIEPPVMALSPTEFTATLADSDSVTQVLTIDNSAGGSELHFNILFAMNGDVAGTPELIRRVGSKGGGRNPGPTGLPPRSTEHVDDGAQTAPGQLTASADSSILVIQDESAWGVNMDAYLATYFGLTPVVITSSNIPNTDFTQYDLIITTGDQSTSYYSAISANVSQFEDYVAQGGIVQYQLATQGPDVTVVGGVSVLYGYEEYYNVILEPDHPLAAGLPDTLVGDWANHNWLSNLPPDAIIITETRDSQVPTTAEYSYGAGVVIATGMTWEYLYYNEYESGLMMYNAVAYSLSVAGNRWISADLTAGVIPAGGGIDITLTFNSTGLAWGSYEANLELSSNDPARPVELIPISLAVTPIGAPQISSITDQPGDEGGLLNLAFTASSHDIAGSSYPIEYYLVWQREPDQPLTIGGLGGAALGSPGLAQTTGWNQLDSVVASMSASYPAQVATEIDSNHTGIHLVSLMVSAHTGMDTIPPALSMVERGYSVDNLPPATPLGIYATSLDTAISIGWVYDLAAVGDFLHFEVFRSNQQDFEPAPGDTALRITAETTIIDQHDLDNSLLYFYRVAAVDTNSNRSLSAVTNGVILEILASLGIPKEYALRQNYPNPFNPNTTLRFETPRQGRVELIVYDLRGREVVRLLDRHMPPGYFDVIWNGKTATGAPIASGMYFARMVTPDYSRTIKMILLK